MTLMTVFQYCYLVSHSKNSINNNNYFNWNFQNSNQIDKPICAMKSLSGEESLHLTETKVSQRTSTHTHSSTVPFGLPGIQLRIVRWLQKASHNHQHQNEKPRHVPILSPSPSQIPCLDASSYLCFIQSRVKPNPLPGRETPSWSLSMDLFHVYNKTVLLRGNSGLS